MKVRGTRSISKTLMFVLLLSSGSALVLATLGFAVNDWLTLRGALYERLRSQAGIIGHNSVAALVFGDAQSARDTLQSLENEADVVGAVLFKADQSPFAVYKRKGAQFDLAPPESEMGSIGSDLFIHLPIALDGENVGSIMLLSRISYSQERQLFHLGIVAGLFLVSLLAAFLLSIRLQRLVTEPILKLAETARLITKSRDYQLRAEKLSRDEIGSLVDDFNDMLTQIQRRDRELIRTREELEDKVKERTSELVELTSQLEHQAFHDTLTGLANRLTFDDHLKLAISQAERHGSKVAVLFLDLDRFKVINDTLGHAMGDKLLVEVANRFKKCLRATDTLARLGGDEFAVLMMQTDHYNDVAEVANKLIEVINRPFTVDGYSLHLTTSIGISVYPEDGDSAEGILKNADTAMYRSKDNGKNRYTFFAPEMNARTARRLYLENKLREAITENKLYLNYQPRRQTGSLEIIGVEALIRWYDPEEGQISPKEFIPLAEECGLTAILDEWVLETACRDLVGWYAGAEPAISLAVNFSAAHFIRKDLPQVIADILQRTGFPGGQLEIEITENLFGPDTGDILELLGDIRKMGIEIAIDDFGKAYSSLARLKQLPLQTLKIDKSFIRDLGRDQDDEILVRTIINMAHGFNLKVVAEGIETDAQYQFVKENGCDIIQGFLFGRPMPLADLKLFVAREGAETTTPGRLPAPELLD